MSAPPRADRPGSASRGPHAARGPGERAAPAAPPDRSSLPRPPAAVHFMGVAGAGMRGLATLLAEEGYQVSGCERAGPVDVPELRSRGATLLEGHDPAHLEGVELLVHSSAVPDDHPELEAARDAGIRTVKRARALGALLNDMRLAAIAGTHGKTTITALAGLACEAAGLDPVVAVGGRVPAWNGFARDGAGRVALVEADEYDRSFLALDPALTLISSIEPEHLDSYGGFDELKEAFYALAERSVGRDGLLYCADDPGAREVGSAIGGSAYGLSSGADYHVERLGGEGIGQRCRLDGPEGSVSFELPVPGAHNVQNAAGALAVALRLGAHPGALSDAFVRFTGVERRLERLAEGDGVVVVDDYAHHPTEVEASLRALRSVFPAHTLVAVFQPHLFSRTRAFAAELAAALGLADRSLLLPIYPSREEPIPGVSSGLILDHGGEGMRLASAEEVQAEVEAAIERGDDGPTVFAFMGAGDITELARSAGRTVTDAVGD